MKFYLNNYLYWLSTSEGQIEVLKYLWSNRHRMTFMPGIGEFFHETDFFQIIRYLHFFNERNAPNRDTTPNYDIYYKVHYKVLVLKKFRNTKNVLFSKNNIYILFIDIFEGCLLQQSHK